MSETVMVVVVVVVVVVSMSLILCTSEASTLLAIKLIFYG